MEARGIMLVAFGGVAALVVASALLRRHHEVHAVDAFADTPEGGVIPAQQSADQGLSLGLTVKREAKRRTLTLDLGGGEATLVLDDAKGSSSDGIAMAFGRGTLVAPDRARGAAFVAAVARWIDTPVPAPRADPTPLMPVRISYVRLGNTAGGRPETMKLFFEAPDLEAELYLNLMPGGRRATLLEKDEDYRKDVVAFLAMALRDGPPPRRSTKNDPRLQSDAPLFGPPVAMAEKAKCLVFSPKGTLLGARDKSLLRWPDPVKPPEVVHTFEARVYDIQPSPDGSMLALTLLKQHQAGVYAAADSAWVVLWDGHTSTAIGLKSEHVWRVSWAPDGKRIALETTTHGTKGSFVRVYDTSGKLVGATDRALDVNIEHWNAGALLLQHTDYSLDAGDKEKFYRWRPGAGPPSSAPAQPGFDSRDGRFHVVVDKDGLSVTGAGAHHRFVATRDGDRAAIDALRDGTPRRLGAHGLLLEAEEPLLLDLQTLKLRRLFETPGLQVQAASPDGRSLVVRGDDGRLSFARAR